MKFINMVTNPKGSYVYKNGNSDYHATLKGSYVYRINHGTGRSTLSGSHPSRVIFFYEHQIPSGLFLESIEANIQKGLAELKKFV